MQDHFQRKNRKDERYVKIDRDQITQYFMCVKSNSALQRSSSSLKKWKGRSKKMSVPKEFNSGQFSFMLTVSVKQSEKLFMILMISLNFSNEICELD